MFRRNRLYMGRHGSCLVSLYVQGVLNNAGHYASVGRQYVLGQKTKAKHQLLIIQHMQILLLLPLLLLGHRWQVEVCGAAVSLL